MSIVEKFYNDSRKAQYKSDLQRQYDLIYNYFKTTMPAFDSLEWDGKNLEVWLDDEKIETYTYADLKEFIKEI